MVNIHLDRVAAEYNHRLIQYCAAISPTTEEKAIRRNLVSRMTDLIQEIWPKAKVELFGSYAKGIYTPTGDIDFTVIGALPSMDPGGDLAKKLGDNQDCNNIQFVRNAKVPVVKMTDRRTGIACDFTFNQKCGMKAVKFIREFLQEYPVLKYLILILKGCLKGWSIGEVYLGGINSYCLIYLIINFLQIPGVYDVQSQQPVNIFILLMKFFHYYGMVYDFENNKIKINNNGAPLLKPRGTTNYISMEDPCKPGNDIGKSMFGAMQVKHAFQYAYMALLNDFLEHRNGPVSPQFPFYGYLEYLLHFEQTIRKRDRAMTENLPQFTFGYQKCRPLM